MTDDEPGRGTVVGCKLTLAQRHSVAGNIGIDRSSTDCKRSGSMFSYHRRHLSWILMGKGCLVRLHHPWVPNPVTRTLVSAT